MKFKMKVFTLIALLCSTVTGSPYTEGAVQDMYNGDYDGVSSESEEEIPVVRTPKFLSEAMSLLVNEGETVRLPCQVDRLQGFVLIWKASNATSGPADENVLAVSSTIANKRFKLEHNRNGNKLVISQVSPADEGEYTCQISAYDPKFIKHKLTVRVAPVIETVPSEVLVVREGEPASLSCQIVKGSPTPSITWTRKHKSEVIKGEQIKWNKVNRHDGGHYICAADNGFSPNPTTREVKLEVHHVPHVEIGEEFVHTAEGEEVRVECSIHCSPRCDVSWHKDGSVVDQTNPNYYITNLAAVHTLTILKVSREYFGSYSCSAENQMGTNSASVAVSGLAHPVVFKDNSLSPWLNKFFLEWTVVSRAKVESFTVEFRAEREFKWLRREVKASVPKPNHEWEGSITLSDLAAATRYEARVGTRNLYGYSNYSKPFHFATKGADPIQQPSVSGAMEAAFASKLLTALFILMAVIPFNSY